MKTIWVEMRIRKPLGREFITELRYDRCMRVVKMGGAPLWLVRTWREPFRTRMFEKIYGREILPKVKIKVDTRYTPMYKSYQEEFRKALAKESTFWSLYYLWRGLGMAPREAFRDARRQVRQSREWKSILRDGQDPRKMKTKAFADRLKGRPRLFS